MKARLTARAVVFVAICCVVYLAGAFYSASFNIATWDTATRALVAIGAPTLGLIPASFPFLFDSLE